MLRCYRRCAHVFDDFISFISSFCSSDCNFGSCGRCIIGRTCQQRRPVTLLIDWSQFFSHYRRKMSLGRSVFPTVSLSRAVQTKNGYKYMNVRLIEFIFVLPMMRPLRPLRLVPLLFLSLCVFWFVTLVQVTVNLLYIFFCVIFFSFHRAQFVCSNRIRQPSQNIVVWASFLFTLIIIEFSVKHT